MNESDEGPLVSVLMNCYNGERYLREAMDSVVAQTYPRWELILWDNQSTDATPEIAKSYDDPRVRYFRALQHTSLGLARELALKQALGDFTAILDCDDIWDLAKLERQVALAQQRPDVGVVYSDYHVISSTGALLGERRRRAKALSGRVFDELLRQDFTVCWPTVVFRTAALNEVGSFAPLRYVEDLELLLRLADRWPFAYVPERLASYRVHDHQLSGNFVAMRDEVLGICDDWEARWGGSHALSAAQRRALARARARAWAIAARNAMNSGTSALQLYARSLREAVSAEALLGFCASLFGARIAASLIANVRRALGYGNI